MSQLSKESARTSMLPKPRQHSRAVLKKPATSARLPAPALNVVAPAQPVNKASRSRLPHPTASRRAPQSIFDATSSPQSAPTVHARAGSDGASRTPWTSPADAPPAKTALVRASSESGHSPVSLPLHTRAPHPARVFESNVRVVSRRPFGPAIRTPVRADAAYPTPPSSVETRTDGKVEEGKEFKLLEATASIGDLDTQPNASTHLPYSFPASPAAAVVSRSRPKAATPSSSQLKENRPTLSIALPRDLIRPTKGDAARQPNFPRPLVIRKPISSCLHILHFGDVYIPTEVKALMDEVDRFAAEWTFMFDDILCPEEDPGSKRSEAAEYHCADEGVPVATTTLGTIEGADNKLEDSDSLPSSPLRTDFSTANADSACHNASHTPSRKLSAASSTTRTTAIDSDDEGSDAEATCFALSISKLTSALQTTVIIRPNVCETSPGPLRTPPKTLAPSTPTSAPYLSLLPETSPGPLRTPPKMLAPSTPTSAPYLSLLPEAAGGDPQRRIAQPHVIESWLTVHLERFSNALSPPTPSPLRAARASPHRSSPLAQKCYTAGTSPGSLSSASATLRSEDSPQQPASPRPTNDTVLDVSQKQLPSSFPINTSQPTISFPMPLVDANPLRRSSSLRTGLGLKSLFRRADVLQASPSTSSLLAPGTAEERARRRRAESLKGMISEPRVVSLGRLRGLGMSIGSVSVSDVRAAGSGEGKKDGRKGGRSSLNNLFGRSADAQGEEYEMTTGTGAKVRRAASARNLLRKKTR
ncbi:hypothetical protein FA95DRAFT_1571392 [Auriscalpium vulgare]|uniref:Uncharacterized protein n=1 Tax=Auriscalpium vulgare TaxID=40419 RepID=A0ACB8RYN8_9AGAM|nr:hypothetical protein FA95DRAFT_1571392 [Auriscalpium vulgare]